MTLIRRLSLFALALLLITPVASRAQNTYPNDNWVPQGLDALGRHASFHSDFTFDRQMLGLVSGLTGDEETQRIVAKLRGISVHVYRYPEPGLYDPAALNTVRMQYRDRGWKHLFADQSNATTTHPGRTDLWIRYDHDNVEGMVLLLENRTDLDLIVVNGTLSPLDLMHLRGHFGIPRDHDGNFGGDNLMPEKQ